MLEVEKLVAPEGHDTPLGNFPQKTTWRQLAKRVAAVSCILAVVLGISILIFSSSKTPDNLQPLLSTETMDTKDLAKNVNAFGKALFSHLEADSKDGNAKFLSPWGIAHALAMLLEGAQPGTASHNQLLEKVFLPTKGASDAASNAVRSSVQALTSSLTSASNEDTLSVSDANSAWVQKGMSLLQPYIDALSTFFKAQARPLESAEVVNSWVKEATRGKITSIIDEQMAQQAALILVNAVYFKGTWEVAFKKEQTTPYPFVLMDGSEHMTPMMYLHEKKGTAVQGAWFQAPLSDDSGASVPCIAAKLAYQGGAYSAVIAMPEGALQQGAPGAPITLENGQDYGAALTACREAILAGISPDASSNARFEWHQLGDPKMKAAKIYLPRFEIEFGATLGPILQKVGLEAIFSPGDFSKISPDGSLYVSDVLHKVYVKVDEVGTEAAAATAIAMMKSGFVRPPPELFLMCDKPFTFSVVHEETGLALFAGEVYKPDQWKEE